MRKNLNAKRSFTLMELLIVIAIIGVLGALIIPTINQARAKARDARRLQDLRTFQTVLELYYNDNQHYPIWEAGGGFQDQAASSTIAAALVPDYLSSLPKDPLIKKYVYYYKSDSTGSLYKGIAYLETEGAKQEYAAKDGDTASKYYEVFAYKGEGQVDFTGDPNDDDSDYLDQKMPSGPKTLTVTKSGTGSGTVTSNPTGINCGSDCSESYNYNTSVTLTAVASGGSTFVGWSGGGCSGTGTCQVTMNIAKDVNAGFFPNPIVLQPASEGIDSYIEGSNPNQNFGDSTILKAELTYADDAIALIKFDLTSIPQSINYYFSNFWSLL